MLLAEKYAQADMNAVRNYERNEGRIEGFKEGLLIAHDIVQKYNEGTDIGQIAKTYNLNPDEIKFLESL